MPIKLSEIMNATGGKIINQKADTFLGVGTDSRAQLTGQLFIALKGETFDAHQFLHQAVQQGATGLLVHEFSAEHQQIFQNVTVIKVPDTLIALQSLSRWVREQMPAKILALTGSNGKTSTKEFAAQILSKYKNVHWSQGSFNNHWGVPFSLLGLRPEHEVAIIEMGMNHAGEITTLVEIAGPDVVVCTMVGRAHIEFFGTQDKIAEAKQEIYQSSAPDSQALFNLDNPFTRKMWEDEKRKYPKRPMMTFSEKEEADVFLKILDVSFEGLKIQGKIREEKGEVFVPVFGKQNITNLLAAAGLSLCAGLTPSQVWEGLKSCRSHWGRNQKVKLKCGATALFDAYNANPDSMEALLENVKAISSSRKIGVFGQMRELGNLSPQFHEEIGFKAGQSGFAKIFFYGDDHPSFSEGVKKSGYSGELHTQSDFSDEFSRKLTQDLQPQDFLVFKASRGPRLERMLWPCEPLDFETKK